MKSYAPGASLEELQRRSGGRAILKLNANENPLGTSERALSALRKVENLNYYGDNSYTELRELLGRRIGVAAQQIVLGHGSNELIALACACFLRSGDEAVMAVPSFSLFHVATRAQNAHAREIPLQDGNHDVDGMLAAIMPKTRLFFICDPNNPTGTALARADWEKLLAGIPPEVVLVVDQAYLEYMDQPSIDGAQLIATRPRTLILRTMSKIYGLASMRIGYGYADPQTIAELEARRTPYNVSGPAASAAAAALEDDDFVQRSRRSNTAGKAFLMTKLRGLGLHAYNSQANFISVGIPVAAERACKDLLERGIAVRSGDALSMPGRLRITIGTSEQNAAVVAALTELLNSWGA